MSTPRTARDPELAQELGPNAGLLEIYRHHARETPSAALDARILALAKRAAEAPMPAPRTWMRYAASITAVVLAAGMGWRLMDTERPERVTATRSAQELPASSAPGSGAAGTPTGAGMPVAAAPTVQTETMMPANGAFADRVRAAEPVGGSAAASAPPAEPSRMAQARESIAESMPPARAEADRPAAAPPPVELRRAPAPPAAAPAPTTQPGWNAAPKAVQELPRLAVGPEAGVAEAAVPSKSAPAAASTAPVAAAPAPADALSLRQRSPLDPQAWLDDVRSLLDSGHLEEARVSLREWRRRYPQLPLPEELAPLLDESSPAPR